MSKSESAHRRLLNAVISLEGAIKHGAESERLAADLELQAAMTESQQVLYPTKEGQK
jgi:hypothetical protein